MKESVEDDISRRRFAVLLPDLGTGTEPIRAGAWLVKRGKKVRRGERILEILVSSAAIDLPSPATGILSETLVYVEDELQVGQVLGYVEVFLSEPAA